MVVFCYMLQNSVAAAGLSASVDSSQWCRIKSTPVDSLSREDYLCLALTIRDMHDQIDQCRAQLKSEKHLNRLRKENSAQQTKNHYDRGFKNGIMAGLAVGISGIAMVIFFYKNGRDRR